MGMNEMTVDSSMRRFLVAMSSTVGGVAVVSAAHPFVFSMKTSARARAVGAPVEVDMSKIEPGMKADVEWRGKPVWVAHRTPEMLEMLGKLEHKLIDPRSENTSQQTDYRKNPRRSIVPSNPGTLSSWAFAPTWLLAHLPQGSRPARPGPGLAGGLPLSRFAFRYGGARARRLARIHQPGGPATQISAKARCSPARTRRQRLIS